MTSPREFAGDLRPLPAVDFDCAGGGEQTGAVYFVEGLVVGPFAILPGFFEGLSRLIGELSYFIGLHVTALAS